MPKQYSIAAARNSLRALVRAVETGPPVELTRHGRPVAVLLSSAEYDRLQCGKPDLWEAIQGFRRTADLESLDVDGVYADVRDHSLVRDADI